MNEKAETVDIINETALELLGNGDFLAAQELFRKNTKKNPCHVSFNNIGVFYTFEGMELPNGKTRNASKLGMKYLKMAEARMQSQKNLMAIGDVLFGQKEYITASDYFKRACALSPSFICFNNLGVSLYMQGDYLNASAAFEKALVYCKDADEIAEIYVSYAYAMVKIDKKKCLEIVRGIVASNGCHIDMDVFILLYLCGDFQAAAEMIKPLFDKYHLDCSVLAMIFDCLLLIGKDNEAEECLRLQIKHLEGYDYDIKEEVDCVKQACFQPEYRQKIIAEYRVVVPIIKGCYYYGCKQHNPV